MKQLLLISLLIPATAFATHASRVKERMAVITAIKWAARFTGVPEDLMLAIAWVESSHRERPPIKPDGDTPSYGVFQIKLETAQWVDKVYKHRHPITITRLLNLNDNALYACKYMKLLLKQHEGDWKQAVDAYNKGHVVSTESMYVKRVQAWREKHVNR